MNKLILIITSISLTGCAWMQSHRNELLTTSEIIGKRVLIIGTQVAIDSVLASASPGATQNWHEYAANSLNQHKWSAINSDDILAIADAWKRQTPDLAPVADSFATLWAKMQPKTQADVDAFMRAYQASLAAPRAVVSIPTILAP